MRSGISSACGSFAAAATTPAARPRGKGVHCEPQAAWLPRGWLPCRGERVRGSRVGNRLRHQRNSRSVAAAKGRWRGQPATPGLKLRKLREARPRRAIEPVACAVGMHCHSLIRALAWAGGALPIGNCAVRPPRIALRLFPSPALDRRCFCSPASCLSLAQGRGVAPQVAASCLPTVPPPPGQAGRRAQRRRHGAEKAQTTT